MTTLIIDDLCQQFSSSEWPQFLAVQTIPSGYTISLLIPPTICWFEGHFPQQPVLAGVVQTHWAALLGKFLFPLGDNFLRMDNLKFQHVILPGQYLNLTLEYFFETNVLKFRYQQNDINFSEGKLVFAQEQT